MVKNFDKWLKNHTTGYQQRIIKGHCKNPKLNLDQLRGHWEGISIPKGYFSVKHKTFRGWLKSQGFNKYERHIIISHCERVVYVYDHKLKLVNNLRKCIRESIDSYFSTTIEQPLNKYYLHGCATYGDKEFSDMGNFYYGFQNYDEFEFTFDHILDILLNNRYNINSFQFFIGLGKEKKIIQLKEIKR